jgi:hypothetical protein
MVRSTTIKLDNEYLEELKAKAKAEDTDVSKYVRKLIKTDIESTGIPNNPTFNIPPKLEDSLSQKPKEIKITPPKEDIKGKENKVEDTNMAETTIDEKMELIAKRVREQEKTNEKLDKACYGIECLTKEIETIKKINVKNKPQKCLSCHQEGAIEGKPFCAECGKPINWKDEDD